MNPSKTSRILVSILLACSAANMTACKKDGGGSKKGKSQRLRWVEKPSSGSASEDGKIITIPQLMVQFHTPDVLYVYKECEEAGHSPEGPDKEWVPVITCSSRSGDGGGSFDDEDDSEDDWAAGGSEDEGSEQLELTFYATAKGDNLISERAVESYKLQYQNAGFKVESITYHDEYLAKPGRRGMEIIVQTINSETGYPDREIRRFMFPKDDVLFIVHIDYPFGDDRSGIDSDWQRILWNFQLDEDGPLFDDAG